MKKEFLKTMSRALLLVCLACTATSMSAEKVLIDGLYYTLSGNYGGATVEKPDSGMYVGDIDIPAEVTYNGVTKPVKAVGVRAFSDDSLLTSVTFHDNMRVIDWYAFANCTQLKRIDMPNTVVSVIDGGFYGCTSLETVTMSNQLASIGWSAFQDCKSLKSIDIPNSCTYLDYSAFQGCSSMTDLVIGNGIQIVRSKAFSGCSSLQNITIGTGVKEFQESAFELCNSNTIKNIYISDLTKWCNIKFAEITSNPFCLANSIISATSIEIDLPKR